jgi:hypothetical protein
MSSSITATKVSKTEATPVEVKKEVEKIEKEEAAKDDVKTDKDADKKEEG